MLVTLQIGDVHHHLFDVTVLPPVGTALVVPKELSKNGDSPTLVVTGYRWDLGLSYDEKNPESRGGPELTVRILTRLDG